MKNAGILVLARGLVRDFGSTRAVAGLTFTVAPGEIYGLVGPDGAGKTTTLRMVAGAIERTAGDLTVADRDPGQGGLSLGYVPQKFGLYQDLTVGENIGFFADLHGVVGARRIERTTRLLAMVDMTRFVDRRAGALSGGMKQKLALACSLIHTPQALVLDEPTNGVDPVSRREFWSLLHEVAAEGVGIVVATAYFDEAEQCHRVGLLDQGRLLDEGTPAALKAKLPGTVYEVTGERLTLPDSRDAFLALDLFGPILRARLASPEVLPLLLAGLEAKGVTSVHARPVAPTIEEVLMDRVGAAA